MPASFDRRINDNHSTYFVQDRKSKQELTRLKLQDGMITAAMGGILSEQANPTAFHHILDVGCGTGNWIIEAAQTYPMMSLVGIDISERMINHARTQAKAHQVNDRVQFQVMDALSALKFPAAAFDLVNLRFGISFVRTWDWPKLLSELLRVTRPNGVIRITEGGVGPQSTSVALKQLWEMLLCALFRSGHLFTQETTGLTDHLAQLLDQHGCKQVQTKAYTTEYRAGTVQGETFCQDMTLMFQTLYPFIQKWGCTTKDYEAIYHQALDEIQQPDFLATGAMLTVWGSKAEPKLEPPRQ